MNKFCASAVIAAAVGFSAVAVQAMPLVPDQARSGMVTQVAGGCGLGALQAAGQAKVWSFGVDADQGSADPSVAASALKKVDVAVYTAIKSVVDGKFVGGPNTFTLQNDGVGYQADNLTLPANVITALNDMTTKIKSGSVTVPSTVP